METYYEVTVKETEDSEKGPKSKNRKLLVEAVSVTDAEARTVEVYEGSTIGFEVVGVKESGIKELVLLPKK